MLTETFSLLLQLPPLAFGPPQPNPWAPPPVLVCDIQELSRPASLRISPRPIPNLPRFATERPARTHLLGPRADALIWVGSMLLVGATGGHIDTRPPEAKVQMVPTP